MDDLRDRLANRVQLTSDGHKAYLEAVDGAFGGDIDYAMLVKFYGATSKGAKGRYSPAECIGARKMPIRIWHRPRFMATGRMAGAEARLRRARRIGFSAPRWTDGSARTTVGTAQHHVSGGCSHLTLAADGRAHQDP